MDPYSQPNPQQPGRASRWPLSKNATILAIAAIFVILVTAIVVGILASRGNDSSSQNDDTSSLTHDRPGYDREKLSAAVADPMALKFSPVNQAISYQGKPVLQACNILTTQNIQDEDLLIKANTIPTPITRVLNDGEGKGAYNQASTSSISGGMGIGMDVNNCNYVLETEDTASISVNVFQPFTVSPSIVNQVISREYSPTGSLEGLEAFKAKSGPSSSSGNVKSEYIFRKGDTSFYLELNLPSSEASKEQALLAKAAKNFTTELSQPTGISDVTYDSPIFTKSYARACDLLTSEDIKKLSGKDASPLVREGIAPSIGLLEFGGPEGKKAYLYVTNECKRMAPNAGASLLSSSASIVVESTSYLEDTPAKLWVESQREANVNNRERMNIENIGDEAVAYIDANNGGNIVFRKGRVAMNVSLDTFAMQTLSLRSLDSVASKLAPVAKDIADRVKE